MGIAGALTVGNNPWAEVLVNGAAMSSRQKILTVPFALFSLDNSQAIDAEVRKRISILERSVAQTSGLLYSNSTTNGTSSENSSGNYLGILNKMTDAIGSGWSTSGSLAAITPAN